MSLVEQVKQYRENNWCCIPIPAPSQRYDGKTPNISWKKYQYEKCDLPITENIGIVTGSISGMWVVDFDYNVNLQKFFGYEPNYVVKTKSGYHVYFKLTDDKPPTNKQFKNNSNNIDIRSDSGYVIAPPSLHKSGIRYELIKNGTLEPLNYSDFCRIAEKNGFSTKLLPEKGGVFDTNHTTIPANQKLRHDGLRSSSMIIAYELRRNNKNLDIDTLIHELESRKVVENFNDYIDDPIKARELYDICKSAIEKVESTESFGSEFMSSKHYFTHINNHSNEFHISYYSDGEWHDNTNYYILQTLQNLEIHGLNPSSDMARKIAGKISAKNTTLQIDIDKSYQNIRSKMIIGKSGKYLDLADRTIKRIDPSIHYFRNIDVNYEIDLDDSCPELFEFLKDIVHENHEIVFDALSTIFLHASILGTRRKATILYGEPKTYKSTIIAGIMPRIIPQESQCSVSILDQAKSEFSTGILADKSYNYIEELNGFSGDHTAFKSNITAESGPYRVMRSQKQGYAYRFPAQFAATNIIPIIGLNDLENSIFDRLNLIKTYTPSKEWRDIVLDDDFLKRAQNELIKRACEIYQNPHEINIQHITETRKVYQNRLYQLDDEIKRFFKKSSYGVALSEIVRLFNYSKSRLKTNLETLGYSVIDGDKVKVSKTVMINGKPCNAYESEEYKNPHREMTIVWGLEPREIIKGPLDE